MRPWVLLLLASACAASAADDWPVLVYPAPRAAAAPRLDGRLDDPGWADCPVAGGFIFYDHPELVPVQTSWRACYDDRALYLGIWCDEPRLDLLKPRAVPHDDTEVFGTECVEVFIDPHHDGVNYFQWGINAAASIYDSRGHDASWDSGATAAATTGKDGWGLTVRIPWESLGVRPAAGQLLGINVCRDRTLAERQWSCWSRVAANFHDPVHFGALVLSPTPAQLAGLGPELRRGDRRGPLRVLGLKGFGDHTYAALARAQLARVTAYVAELKAIGEREGSGTAARVQARLTAAEERLAPIRRQLSGDVDGADYARLELLLSGLERDLGEVLWDARLAELLSRL
jgi:hypothetical protein